ncbi:MAG: hypothetical protein JNK73_03340 [Bacteroidia bacterium]|nr:hypothetical protein [Bacteroidia bacterium]
MDSKSKIYDIKPPNSVLFKLPELKDPVICICFSTVLEAQRTNADLFEKWRHEHYTLTLFATKLNANVVLNIYLISDNNQRLYKHLGFDQHKLNWWLQRTQGHGTKYKFCHVTQKFDKLEVVKPANQGSRYYVLNVKKVIVQDLMELSY